jgi:hypothetical protein
MCADHYGVKLFCLFVFQIVEQGLMTRDEWNEACSKALALFAYGQVGLISDVFHSCCPGIF